MSCTRVLLELRSQRNAAGNVEKKKAKIVELYLLGHFLFQLLHDDDEHAQLHLCSGVRQVLLPGGSR